ncbi:hypothetical protein GE061_010828 [Apolygus lucorum]|uniref:Uncharacterized protein n=1 Tax=Apolygus lucorum TaxID=248454 RepID=A0A6A4K4S2_APOLU|nr:hypothetical protein GE061_010828 [Apolygus lucorum]
MEILTSLLLALTTVLCVTLFVIRRLLTPAVSAKGTTNIPEPVVARKWPILGHALVFYGVNNMKELLRTLKRIAYKREKVMSFYMGPKLVINISDAKILEATISNSSKCQNKEAEFYHPFESYFTGLFAKNGKVWSALRRPLDRLLHAKNMDNFLNIIAEKAEILCCKLGDQCGQGVFDIKHFMDYYFLDITLEAILNVPGTQQFEDTMNFPKLAARMIVAVFTRVMKIEYRSDWIYSLSPLARKEYKWKEELRPHLKEMVNNCHKHLETTGRDPSDSNFVPENFVEVAIQAGICGNKTEEDVLFSFHDVIIAGFDTSSVASSSAILFLAIHPEYQERAYQEQIEVMKDSFEAPTKEQLSRMRYLDMVFNETLRHVSVPAIARTVSSQFTIDGYIFPEGASLFIFYHTLFHKPEYWERPNDFYPDHFLPEKVAERPKGAFLPFGFGGRVCPGKLFGVQSSKLALSMFLRRFKAATSLKFDEIDYNYMVMLESDKGYPIEITSRQKHLENKLQIALNSSK